MLKLKKINFLLLLSLIFLNQSCLKKRKFEGIRVWIYSSLPPHINYTINSNLTKKFPHQKINWINSSSINLEKKINQEIDFKNLLADILLTSDEELVCLLQNRNIAGRVEVFAESEFMMVKHSDNQQQLPVLMEDLYDSKLVVGNPTLSGTSLGFFSRLYKSSSFQDEQKRFQNYIYTEGSYNVLENIKNNSSRIGIIDSLFLTKDIYSNLEMKPINMKKNKVFRVHLKRFKQSAHLPNILDSIKIRNNKYNPVKFQSDMTADGIKRKNKIEYFKRIIEEL